MRQLKKIMNKLLKDPSADHPHNVERNAEDQTEDANLLLHQIRSNEFDSKDRVRRAKDKLMRSASKEITSVVQQMNQEHSSAGVYHPNYTLTQDLGKNLLRAAPAKKLVGKAKAEMSYEPAAPREESISKEVEEV